MNRLGVSMEMEFVVGWVASGGDQAAARRGTRNGPGSIGQGLVLRKGWWYANFRGAKLETLVVKSPRADSAKATAGERAGGHISVTHQR